MRAVPTRARSSRPTIRKSASYTRRSASTRIASTSSQSVEEHLESGRRRAFPDRCGRSRCWSGSMVAANSSRWTTRPTAVTSAPTTTSLGRAECAAPRCSSDERNRRCESSQEPLCRPGRLRRFGVRDGQVGCRSASRSGAGPRARSRAGTPIRSPTGARRGRRYFAGLQQPRERRAEGAPPLDRRCASREGRRRSTPETRSLVASVAAFARRSRFADSTPRP